ncbi:g11083 [Coccomyxa viridis]|uniref:G11083 protein n=1 Tax=Coccomyxa viridis TaxID=1274662 RepID=A0ABP1G717_9CHLO
MSLSNTMSPSHAAPSEAPAMNAPAAPQAPLVGAVGQEYVHSVLTSMNPQNAVKEIQKHGAFRNKRGKPVLELLDQLGLKRAEVYKHVLEAAKARLLEAIPKMSPEKLTQLLELSFAYVGLPQLRDIPLAVLGQLQPVPAAFLKQLATDQELFQDLPLNVQQEVWEVDRKMLQQHALPTVEAYGYTTETLLRALDMDEFLPGPVGAPAKLLGGPRVSRRAIRAGSAALKRLTGMAGRSLAIYNGLADLCRVRLRDSESPYCGIKEASYCTLRSQLIMALHDNNISEITSKDPVHRLAWSLDACLKDRVLDEKRMRELHQFFVPLNKPAAGTGSLKIRMGGAAKKRARESSAVDAESMGSPGRSTNAQSDPLAVLGDAGMVLRDPATMRLIIHHVLRRLERLVEEEKSPSEDPDLTFLTSLMQLAVGCRAMLRGRRFSFPAADPELLRSFYPLLMNFMLEVLFRDGSEVLDDGKTEVDANLVTMLSKDEVVRHISQVFCLERLAASDIPMARSLLSALVQALEKMSERALPEFAPFAATLAQRLTKLVAAGQLAPDQPLWQLAVDRFLVLAVDTEGQVHEEVLRLFSATVSKLSAEQLAKYLQMTLQHSRKSRKRTKRRQAEVENLQEAVANAGYETAGYTGYYSSGFGGYGTGAFSDGRLMDRQEKPKLGGDGVKFLYQALVQRQPGLNEQTAPLLMQYLSTPDPAPQLGDA